MTTPTTAALDAAASLLRLARTHRWDTATTRRVLLLLALRIAADGASDDTILAEVRELLEQLREHDAPPH